MLLILGRGLLKGGIEGGDVGWLSERGGGCDDLFYDRFLILFYFYRVFYYKVSIIYDLLINHLATNKNKNNNTQIIIIQHINNIHYQTNAHLLYEHFRLMIIPDHFNLSKRNQQINSSSI